MFIGSAKFSAGVRLSTFIEAAQRWYDIAAGNLTQPAVDWNDPKFTAAASYDMSDVVFTSVGPASPKALKTGGE